MAPLTPYLLSLPFLSLLTTTLALSHADDVRLLHSGRPQIGLWQAMNAASIKQSIPSSSSQQQVFKSDPSDGSAEDPDHPLYRAHCFEQPLDHFDAKNEVTFCQRYWVSTEFFKKGSKGGDGPVIVLDGGETSGANRLPFLETGIVNILTNATNGIGIILEHRYYGKSLPSDEYLPSLSTFNLQYLTNEQAELDSIRFIESLNLTHLGIHESLHPTARPWIYYGGSYAGARAAHLRKGWPNTVYGAIASSAVTHAQVDYWEYFDAIRQWAPDKCMRVMEDTIEAIDGAIDVLEPLGLRKRFQGLFGLQDLEHVEDFGETIASVLGSWQARNWDPEVGSSEFYRFCDILTAGGASSAIGPVRISSAILNYAGYVKKEIVARCPADDNGDRDIEDCFGTYNAEKYAQNGRDQKWRLWLYQVCTQWGYFMPAPPSGKRIVSKFLTLEYSSKVCKLAFPPENGVVVPEWPNVDSVNSRGDFALEEERLAFIDGDSDPWRPATPQSDYAIKRNSTTSQPVYLISDAVHHFDENGLADHTKEPKRIRRIHAEEVDFVKAWLKKWKKSKQD